MPSALLETRDLTKELRGVRAVSGVSVSVDEGSVHALIGPQGSGKTTLVNLLTGFLVPTSGQICFRGRDITGSSPEQMARLGIGRAFRSAGLFAELSVLDHVALALARPAAHGRPAGPTSSRLRELHHRALELLDEVGLADRSTEPAGSLGGVERCALDLARAIAPDPRLLLLDEPTAGMVPADVERAIELVRRVGACRTLLLVDPNMAVVGSLADTVTVLLSGAVLAEGTYDEVRRDASVVSAYLSPGSS